MKKLNKNHPSTNYRNRNHKEPTNTVNSGDVKPRKGNRIYRSKYYQETEERITGIEDINTSIKENTKDKMFLTQNTVEFGDTIKRLNLRIIE